MNKKIIPCLLMAMSILLLAMAAQTTVAAGLYFLGDAPIRAHSLFHRRGP
jgi:hypothetical protein